MSLIHVVSSLTGGPARILTEVMLNSRGEARGQVLVLNDRFVEQDLLLALRAQGHEVQFFSRKRRLDIWLLWNVRRVIRRTGPDTVISYDFASNVIAAISVLGARTQWFPGVHGLETAFKWWRAMILRIIFIRGSRVVVPAKAVQNKLAQHKIIRAGMVAVIPNGIMTNGPTRHEAGPKGEFRLVCVANFYSEVKGQKYAVEAIKLLSCEYTLSFIGDGKELNAVRDLAKRYQLEERVEFLGALDNSVMRERLVDYDAMVVPSVSESFGIAAIEGMAAGLPIIASGVGGLPEVVNEECGLLVPMADPEALANGIRHVYENPNTWEKMHKGALKRVRENYSAETMAARYYQTFSDTMLGAGHA